MLVILLLVGCSQHRSKSGTKVPLQTEKKGKGKIKKTPNQELYKPGTEVELTAEGQREDNWQLAGWAGSLDGTEKKKTVVAKEGLKAVAKFVNLPEFDLEEKSVADDAINNQGLVYVKLGKLETAKERFKKALQIDPEFAKAYGGLGRVYYEQGKLDKAASKFRRATELNARSPKSYYYLGKIYQRQGKKEKALKKYKYAALLGNKQALQKIKELNAGE